MQLPLPVLLYVEEHGWGRVERAVPVSGGCINDGHTLVTSHGPQLFLKTNHAAPADMFECEAIGLEALRVEGAPRVPVPYYHGPEFLLMEHLEPAPVARGAWEEFGRRVARLHAKTSPRFGFGHDNYIGSTPQPNTWSGDGWAFFAGQRLLYQARLARDRGLLGRTTLHRLERLATRLSEWVPEQPASLLHGDLWNGNVMPGPDGQICMIDPAVYYGWAEADLAMTALFGQLPAEFYHGYESGRSLAPGYRARFDIYNLYHLLNHLNLFGSSYLPTVEGLLARYG